MHLLRTFSILVLAVTNASSAVLVTTEGFDDVASLSAKGWILQNLSQPVGSTSWFQGNAGVFGAQSGPDDSYIAANFLNAGAGGLIQNLLISPILQFENGSQVSFWTRTETNPAVAADRLRLRFSDNDTSVDISDFNTILSVNEGLTLSGYPDAWTQFVYTFSGLSGIARGRLAFEYSVPDTSANGNYIGIDSLVITSNIPEPTTTAMFAGGMLMLLLGRKRRRVALMAAAGVTTLLGTSAAWAEEKPSQQPKPKWQSVKVEVVQKEGVLSDTGPRAGRIYVRNGESAPLNASAVPRAPKSKTGDSSKVKLTSKGSAAKLGPSYLSPLRVTRNSDSSLTVSHAPAAKAGSRMKEVRRDR